MEYMFLDKNKIIKIALREIDPNIRRSALTYLDTRFCSGPRMIYHYQMLYVYEGRGIFIIDGNEYPAKKGDLFFWGPGQIHQIISDVSNPMALIGAQFDFTNNHRNLKYRMDTILPEDFIPDRISQIVEFTDFQGFDNYTKIHNISKVEEMLLDIVKEYKMQKLYCDERMNGIMKAFLILLARQTSSDKIIPIKNGKLTDDIIQYIHNNLDKKITNKNIAEVFHFHPNYINKLMVGNTGISLHQYLINVRINKAIELINESNMSISKIADKVGYSSIHYFSKIFKNKTGISPTKF